MARQYIEPMPAIRPLRAPARRRMPRRRRWPSLCAVCRGWGRGRVCADCRDRFAAGRAALPALRACRCRAGVEHLRRLPADAAAVRRRLRRASTTPIRGTGLIAAFKFHGALDLAPVFADADRRAPCAERARRAPTLAAAGAARRRSGCASAATTRPGSWRAALAPRLGARADADAAAAPARHAAPARAAAGRARRQRARRLRGRAAPARRAARPRASRWSTT